MRLILAAILTCILITTAASAYGQRLECGRTQVLTTGCASVDASNDGTQVTLNGSATTPGSGSPGTGGTRSSAGAGVGSSNPADAPLNCTVVGTKCRGGTVGKGSSATPAPPRSTPPVTLRDLANFRPAPGIQRMEPDGWVVAGLDANIYAIAGRQLVAGTLLGQPATVRFTPVSYRWNYGDGTSAVLPRAGGTWASQGVRDFDPTPTSHVYGVEGEYLIRLTIDFRAEYSFSSGSFTPIAGTINLPANDLRVTVTGAKTVLVERDCVVDPAGPGC
jgi:hypothetical protein